MGTLRDARGLPGGARPLCLGAPDAARHHVSARLSRCGRGEGSDPTTGSKIKRACRSRGRAVEQLVDDLRRVRIQRSDGGMESDSARTSSRFSSRSSVAGLGGEAAAGCRKITEAELSVVGEVDTALGDYYAEQVGTRRPLPGVGERRIWTWFEQKLIVGQGIRGRVLRGADESEGLGNQVIQRLESAHLIRAEERHGITWYELAHDRLIVPIRGRQRPLRRGTQPDPARRGLVGARGPARARCCSRVLS